MPKVMIFGTFDGLHQGHLNFFEQALKYGQVMTIIVARDSNVIKIKGQSPVYSEKERLTAVKKKLSNLAENKIKIRLGQLRDPLAIIRSEKPKIICLGYDQNSYTADLKKNFPEIKIIRLKAFKPEIYKSSIINSKK